jgi:small-conductance mechanosensitive channel
MSDTGTPLLQSAPQLLSPPPPLTPADASVHLEHRLTHRWDDLLTAVTSSSFYVELLLIIAAIALAGLVANLISKRIKQQLKRTPIKFIDSEFITKPLLMLAPTLAIPFLWEVQALMAGLGLGGTLSAGAIELACAYWLTKCVTLVIRFRPVALLISGAIIVNAFLHATRISRSASEYLQSVAFDAGPYHITALHLVRGLIIFVVVFWGAGLFSQTLESYLRRSTRMSANTRHLIVKIFRIFIYVTAILITLSALGIDLTALAIFSGALGVGIGLGLQKITANFVSGVTVLMERSIKIGDLIEIAGNTGWVRQLNTRYALLETSDGREILIPNEELISSRVVNWTLNNTLARVEINVTTTFDSDPEKVRKLLLEAAGEHELCLKDPKPSCWLKEFTNTGLHFVLNFWISDVKEGRNGPQSDVQFSILKKFSKNKIELAKG